MDFKIVNRIFLLLICLLFCAGFKTYPNILGYHLDVSSTATRKVFVTFPNTGKTLNNNLPGNDVLGSAGSTLTEAQIINSVLNDYNSIQDSNLILVADSDTDYAANNTNHRIIMNLGTADGLSSGEASWKYQGAFITSCNVVFTADSYRDAKFYTALVAHEIGHCLGLDHAQETENAVMSYFYNDGVYRLGIDDKMGIVHLYAKSSSYSDEQATFGLSCARK